MLTFIFFKIIMTVLIIIFLAGKCENSTNPSCQDDLIKIEVPMVLYVSRILANLPLKIGQCKVTEGNCVCDQSIEDHSQCKFHRLNHSSSKCSPRIGILVLI